MSINNKIIWIVPIATAVHDDIDASIEKGF